MVIAESSFVEHFFFHRKPGAYLFWKNYIGSRVLSVRLKKVCNFQFCSIIKMNKKTVLHWKSFIRQGFDKLMAILMNFSPTAVKSQQRRSVEALDFNRTSSRGACFTPCIFHSDDFADL